MGITYNSENQSFEFDFEHDGQNDIIMLTETGYQVEAFGKCFYYGYEFSSQVDSAARTKFIQYVKFTHSLQQDPNLTAFMQKAVNNLDKKIDLYDYDLVIMPESSSFVNRYLLRYIYRFAQPTLRSIELVKNLPSRIVFDREAYEQQYLNDVLGNGRPRYTELQKQEALHSVDFRFLRFESDADRDLCAAIRKQNILVVDDITTSGSTLNEILRALRILNEDNSITVFSLIGRKDLMAESI